METRASSFQCSAPGIIRHVLSPGRLCKFARKLRISCTNESSSQLGAHDPDPRCVSTEACMVSWFAFALTLTAAYHSLELV